MTSIDRFDVEEFVRRVLAEDLGSGGDVTSAATIAADARFTASINCREAIVVAGLEIAAAFFRALDSEVNIEAAAGDGDHVPAGTVLMRLDGNARAMLAAERSALNTLQHLSGIATLTRRYVDAIAGTGATLLDTRKTLPGLRALQKYAVRCGGGVNHRFSLADMAMVKDNHVIAAGGVVPALEAVRAAYPGLPVEVEVTDLDQLRELLAAGCDRILLDNMDAATMTEAVRITGGRASLEASGGLTLERAREVAETGVDFISVGALTHSVTVFDLGMDLSDAVLTAP
jgi:nicotinate-nucleotide pyrophosphorylase (carboxylating)